jgi:transcriptional regulator with XRE-family HTH domain
MTENIGDRIETLRRARGWRQQQLAENVTAAGIQWHTSTVSKVEKDQRVLKPEELLALGAIFGVTVDELLSGLRQQDPADLRRQIDWQVWNGNVMRALYELINVVDAIPDEMPEGVRISDFVRRLAREAGDRVEALAGGRS